MLPAVLNSGRNTYVASSVIMPCVGRPESHQLIFTHNGENVGALATFTLLPECESAVIVLGNTTALGDATDIIAQMLIQDVLGVPRPIDYVALTKKIATECSGWFERTLSGPLTAHRIANTPVGELSEYVGTYNDSTSRAVISIIMENRGLVFHRGGLALQKAPLKHYHYETFSFAVDSYDEHMRLGLIDYYHWEQLLITFERGVDGKVTGAKWLVDEDLSPFLFKKA